VDLGGRAGGVSPWRLYGADELDRGKGPKTIREAVQLRAKSFDDAKERQREGGDRSLRQSLRQIFRKLAMRAAAVDAGV